MECNCIIGIPIQNLFDSLFVPRLLFPRFASLDAILRLELSEKNKSPTLVASTTIYVRRERSYLGPLSQPKKNRRLLHRKARALQYQVAKTRG
jgi:hypothetical protein